MKEFKLLFVLAMFAIASNAQQILTNQTLNTDKLFVKHINLKTQKQKTWEVKSESIKNLVSNFSLGSKGTTSMLNLDEKGLKSIDKIDSTLHSRNLPEFTTLILNHENEIEYNNAVLIDPFHVLATAHFNTSISGTPEKIIVRSLNYSNGLNNYDVSQATDVYLFTTDPNDFANNMALLTLSRPLGSILGWMGYGYNSDTYYNENTFYINQIITKEYTKLMQNFSASSPSFVTENALYYLPYRNMAGGAPFYNNNNVVYGVVSHWARTMNAGDTTYYDGISKIDQQKFNTIQTIVNNDKPEQFDLLPLKLTVKPDTINILNPIEELELNILNYSKVTFNDTILIDIHLNNDNILDDNDPIVAKYRAVGSINPTHKMVINTTNSFTLPLSTKTGEYSLAAVIQTVDANLYNNITMGKDCGYFYVNNPYATNQISGTIVTSGESPGAGYCMLFEHNENSLGGLYSIVAVDETLNFEFEDVFTGKYIIVYIPKNSNNHRNIPTYFNQTPYWQNATVLEVGTFDTINNITLERIELPEITGTKSISGLLSFSENKSTKSATDDFFNDVTLLLENKENQSTCGSCYPDNTGLFTFENVTNGSYSILVDKPGFTLTKGAEVNISNETEIISDVNFTFYPDSTIEATNYTKSSFYLNENISIAIYPNPASDIITIETNFAEPQKGTLKILDTSGKCVATSEFKNSNINQFNLKNLSSGTYFLELIVDENIYSRVIIKE